MCLICLSAAVAPLPPNGGSTTEEPKLRTDIVQMTTEKQPAVEDQVRLYAHSSVYSRADCRMDDQCDDGFPG